MLVRGGVIVYQIIPAENMVAAFQEHGGSTALYATATTAVDAQVYLEALEKGTDGVVLHTDDPSEVFALKVRASLFWVQRVDFSHLLNVFCFGCIYLFS